MSRLERGSLLDQYEEIARQEDANMRRLAADNTFAQFKSIGEAVSGSLVPEETIMSTPISVAIETLERDYEKKQVAAGYNHKSVIDHLGCAREFIQLGRGLCETPIEVRLLPWLVFEDFETVLAPTINPVVDLKAKGMLPRSGLFIAPQFEIMGYRLDFAIVKRSGATSRIMAIECDGQDFHFAAKDTLRDGRLACLGIRTFRLRGPDIYHEPAKCAARAAAAFMEG